MSKTLEQIGRDCFSAPFVDAYSRILRTACRYPNGSVYDTILHDVTQRLVKLEEEKAKLVDALMDHHLGLNTTRPFEETYARDEALLAEANNPEVPK